ncbi:MAG: lysylphosphatidylglycerol synthase domain-containing protein [Wenzhouxiangellaceae bacterium]
MSRLHLTARILGLLGVVLFIGLIWREGAAELAGGLAMAGWALLLVPAWHLLTMTTDGLALKILLAPRTRLAAGTAVHLRWLQESVNNLLPVMQIGGNLVKVAGLTRRGMATDLAGAAVVIDVTLTVTSQIVFTLLGLVLLLVVLGPKDMAGTVLIGALLMSLMIYGFYLVQKRGLFSLLTALLGRIRSRADFTALAGGAEALDRMITQLYRQRAALYGTAAMHLLAWIIGIGEVWVAMQVLGYPIGLVEAALLESLGRALRTAAFAIPGAIGVQEGGFIVFGALIGLPADAALLLALAKRVRELVLGLPGLLVWQIESGRDWLGRARHARGSRTS